MPPAPEAPPNAARSTVASFHRVGVLQIDHADAGAGVEAGLVSFSTIARVAARRAALGAQDQAVRARVHQHGHAANTARRRTAGRGDAVQQLLHQGARSAATAC